MEQKAYWNQVSEQKEFTTLFQADAFAQYVKQDAKVLDVGCGYGRVMEQLYHIGYRNMAGVDISEKMIERGEKQFPHLKFEVTREGRLSETDESCDAVILAAVLTCIVDNKKQLELIDEIHRVLKPGGILYVNDFLLNEDDRNIKRYEQFQEKYGVYGVFELPEGAVLRHHDISWVMESFKAFKKVLCERIQYATMNGHQSEGYYYIGRK